MNRRVPLLALALLTAGSAAFAQLDRRSRDEPEIVLDHGGRVGFCDMMRWDASGQFLFAGGDDKCVTVWPVDLTAKGGPVLKAERTDVKSLRWPAWREKRGGIKNLAVHPSGDKVAVGGMGLIPSAVGVLSRTNSTVAETVVEAYAWPRSTGANFGTVTAIAYDEKGGRIAFGTADGSLWVWEPKKLKVPEPETEFEPAREWTAPMRAGQHTLPQGAKAADLPTRSRLVFFRGDKLLSVAMSGEVVECDVSAKANLTDRPVPAPPVTVKFHLDKKQDDTRVYRAELTPDGKAITVAFMGPAIGLFPLDGNGKGELLPLGEGYMARSIAVEPGSGRVAVAVGGAKPADGNAPRFFIERENAVRVYPALKAGAEPTDVLPTGGRVEAVAFHPTRKGLLAAAGGDADEVRLFDLTRAKPAEPSSVVRGAGRKIFGVGIVGNTSVAVKVQSNPNAAHPNQEAGGEWVTYDLVKQAVVEVPGERSEAVNAADGWTVTPDDDPNPDKRRRERWYAVGPGGKRELVLDRTLFNDPTCYTFVPKGAGKVTRLLVGHAHGCSLFDLPDQKGADPLTPTAVYMGHTTEVLSVAADAKGEWFVTGGADHTVAAFSLKPWAGHPTLGAAFEAKGEKVVVKSVAVGSPAWESGLMANDVIERVVLDKENKVYNRKIDEKEPERWGTPEKAVAALKAPAPPGKEVFLLVGGKETAARKTTVQQRPLWKWFPAFADAAGKPTRVSDSVVWMWKGARYHSETTEGDQMVGWHVNPPAVLGSTRYHRLKEFQHIFHTPDAIDAVLQLISTRDVAAALTAALGDNPQPPSFAWYDHEPVKLAVLDKRVGGKAGEKVRLQVTVTPNGGDPDLLPDRVEVWVNDFRKEVVDLTLGAKRAAKTFDRQFVLDAGELRAGDNKVTVLAYNPRGGRGRNADVVTNQAAPPENPTLVGWVGGVNKYKGIAAAPAPAPGARAAFAGLNPLRVAVPDAKAVSTRFGEYSGKGKYYQQNRLELKTDAEVEPKPLLDTLTDLAKPGAVKPDDTLVIFLAGHGVLIGDDKANGQTVVIPFNEPKPEDNYKKIRFAFCGVNFDPADPVGTGIPAEVLFEKLVAVNCRKLVFLDVCHAGGVQTDVVRRLLPDGQGPLVFASCGHGEQSHEGEENGLFTRALLEATGPKFLADRDRDGAISCEELVEFCTEQVFDLRVQMLNQGRAKDKPQARYSDQNPTSNLKAVVQPRTPIVKRVAAK